MALSLLPTAALADEGAAEPENYVTLELTYGSSVTGESIAAAKTMYEGKKYDTCKAANEAFMALYGVSWVEREGGNPYLNVTNNDAPLRAYATNADAVTEVKYYIHGTLAGFTSLQSDGNQIDCTVGGNHQIPRTSISIIGVGDGKGNKAKLTDGNVQAYVAGGYDSMFRSSGTLTIQNIEFANVGTTIIAASSAIDTSTNKTVNSAKMIIENCKFDGTLSMYSNFLNNGVMDYTIQNCEFDGTNATGNFAIWPQNTNATAKLNYGPAKLTISDNKISGYQRGINIDNASTDVVIEKNTIIPGVGYSAVQLSRTKNAQIKSNDIVLNGGNVITLYEKLLEMSTAPEVSIENNTITGTGYLIYDDAAANNKSFTSDKLKLTYSSNTVPSTVDTTKGVKGSKTTDLTGYVAAVAQGKDDITGKVAQVGTEYYTTLTEAFAALDGTNHTLTLIHNSAWNTSTPVYWKAGDQSDYAATLKAALAAAQTGTDNVQIVCRPGATIISDGWHYDVTNNVTIYANGANFGGNDLSIGAYAAPENSPTTINIYDARNLVVWGQPFDDRPDVWKVNFTDCVNDGWNFLMYRGRENGKATINATLTGCKATGFKDSIIHTTADGSITIKNCEFVNNCAPVNIAHKQAGEMTVTVENSTFTNCGETDTTKDLYRYAAPVRIVNNNAAGTVATEVTNCTFAGTVGNNGDILIGDGRDGKESKDVSLTVKNTAANVQAQKPGYYNAGTADLTKMMAKQVAENERLETSVNKLLPNAAKIGNTEYATLKEALESLSNTTEENVTIELLADQNVAGFTVDLSNSAIKTLTIQGNGKKLDSLVNGVGIDGPTRCPVINAKLPANATFSVDGIVAPNSLLFDTGNEASLVVMNSTFNESQTGYPAAKNITYQGNTFEFKGDASKYYTNNAYPIWYKTETTTRSIAFLNNKVTGPRGFHIETRSTDADKQVNIKANGNTFNLSDSMYENKTIALQLVANLNGEIEFKDNQVNAYMGVCFFKDIATQNDSKLTIKNNYTSGKLYGSSEWNTAGSTTEEKIAAADDFAREIVEGRKSANNGSAITEGHTHNYVNGKCTICGQTAPSYSGSSSYDPTYSVSTPSKTKNGTVTVSPKNASKGDTVTVTVKPDSGYVLETLTVTDKNGNELTLKDKGNGKYTFTMPAGKVEVKATFMEDNSMLNFFYDVPNNAYFYEAVKWAVENGITTGVGNDLFAPEQPCTRAQIVTFLWRAAGSPEPKGASSFADVAAGSYYAKAVAWAVENGITTGTGDGKFSPDATCTRAQAVTFLARALSAKASGKAEFSDVPADSYFADAVAWAAANGVTEGIGGGLFGSDNDCTRGQIVTFLYRAYNK